MPRILKYTVEEDLNGEKIIKCLRENLQMSARMVVKLRHTPEAIKLNGVHARTVDKLKTGDVLEITFPEEKNEIPATHFDDISVLYEDEDILVINKPAGLAMHPTHNHQGDTLANEVAAYLAQKNKYPVFRAVGRLDKSTSGVVVCALNKHSASRLAENITKEYVALVEGEYKGHGTINKKIYRPDPMKTLRAVGEEGDEAVTHWREEIASEKMSLVRINLETGRTHQIRVHFSSMGTPLAGDDMYGSESTDINRAALHCENVTLVHPVTGEKMFFKAEMPEDMKKIADKII
ncbi:MAG: RluA family pseudouridine synthase [Clostridia bacterium]|nr:RluA family pseudouridine synthase [Clostridia bacterium]